MPPTDGRLQIPARSSVGALGYEPLTSTVAQGEYMELDPIPAYTRDEVQSGRRPLFGVHHHCKDSISLGHLINRIKAPSLYGSNIEAKSISKRLLVCTQTTTRLGVKRLFVSPTN